MAALVNNTNLSSIKPLLFAITATSLIVAIIGLVMKHNKMAVISMIFFWIGFIGYINVKE